MKLVRVAVLFGALTICMTSAADSHLPSVGIGAVDAMKNAAASAAASATASAIPAGAMTALKTAGKSVVKEVKEVKGKKTSASRAITTPKPIICKDQNFQQLNDCCKEQIGYVISQESRYKCYTNWDNMNHVPGSKDYMINKWQFGVPPVLDIVSDATMKIFSNIAKYKLDIPLSTSILNATLNELNILAYFKNSLLVNTEANRNLVLKSAGTCLKSVPAAAALQQRDACNVLPFLLMQCIRREILLTCTYPTAPDVPAKQKIGTFKVFTDFCDARRKILESCPFY